MAALWAADPAAARFHMNCLLNEAFDLAPYSARMRALRISSEVCVLGCVLGCVSNVIPHCDSTYAHTLCIVLGAVVRSNDLEASSGVPLML